MGPLSRALFAIGLGFLVGTAVGVANLLSGLATNWLTLPAWMACGAMIGAAHPTAELLLHVLVRVGDRIDALLARPGDRPDPDQPAETEW